MFTGHNFNMCSKIIKSNGTSFTRKGFKMKKTNKHTLIHIGFALIVVIVIVVIANKFLNFINGNIISNDEFNETAQDVQEIENMDYILPLVLTEDQAKEDDGVNTVVCFGNAPFADDRDSKDNLCNMIAELTGATVYNFSIPDSTLSHLDMSGAYMFSFYWLTTGFCIDNYIIYENLEQYENYDPVWDETINQMRSLDFNTVDTIVIMYDATDYLLGRPIYSIANFEDPTQFTGAMAAGINLIQTYYPHIRIIVSSPTYAFGLEEDGSYVSSDIKTYGETYLSTYVVKQADAAYELSVSFIDNIYGTIHEDIASDYLTDYIHLNTEGRKLVAQRIADAINKYPTPVIY